MLQARPGRQMAFRDFSRTLQFEEISTLTVMLLGRSFPLGSILFFYEGVGCESCVHCMSELFYLMQ